MKKIMLTILYTTFMMVGVVAITHGQQRPSQRSFTSVMNEVKQKQADRDKMLKQIKQSTPSNTVSQNGTMQVQANTANSTQPAPAQQRSQSVQTTNLQRSNKKQANQQQIKKE